MFNIQSILSWKWLIVPCKILLNEQNEICSLQNEICTAFSKSTGQRLNQLPLEARQYPSGKYIRIMTKLMAYNLLSDRVQKKWEIMRRLLVGICVNYEETNWIMRRISRVHKIKNKAFQMYKTTVKQKALQSLIHYLSSH